MSTERMEEARANKSDCKLVAALSAAPFEKFTVEETYRQCGRFIVNTWPGFIIQENESLVLQRRAFKSARRRFIEDAIREKLEREQPAPQEGTKT